MRNTFTETMLEVGLEDPNLVVLVGDISHFALQPFAKACPGRYYNIGICEQTILSMAAGLAHNGFYPVVHTIAPFIIERGFEQIKLDFCYQELGGTLISVGSAFDYSGLGVSHYCYNDIALIKTLPRTQIIYPAMPNEFNILFKETMKNDKLKYFRLPSEKHECLISDDKIKFGKAVLIKEGTDITIVTTGPQLKNAMQSISLLNSIGIDAEIIYLHTIKPFDYDLVRDSILKTKKYLIIEEHSEFGGISEDVNRVALGIENVKSAYINIPNTFNHGYGSYDEHCAAMGFTPENIFKQVENLCLKNV